MQVYDIGNPASHEPHSFRSGLRSAPGRSRTDGDHPPRTPGRVSHRRLRDQPARRTVMSRTRKSGRSSRLNTADRFGSFTAMTTA